MGENLHEGHRARMREKMKKSMEAFSKHELLEILLYYCVPRKNTNEMAHKLLNEFGTFTMLFHSNYLDLMKWGNINERTALLFVLLREIMLRMAQEEWEENIYLNSTAATGKFLIELMSHETEECFYVLCMSSDNKLIYPALINRGTVTETYVSSRNIMEAVLRYNASSVILAHNHPGGSVRPSMDDIDTTRRITALLKPIDVVVLDHVIVSGKKYQSFSDANII